MLILLKGILIISSVLLLIMIVVLVGVTRRKNKSDLMAETYSRKWKFDDFKARVYVRLSQFSLTKRYVADIRERLAITSNLSEERLRQKVVTIFIISLGAVGVLSMTFLSLTKEPFLVAVFFIALYFMSETIIEFFVDNMRNKLIRQQIVYNEVLRIKFYENRMIDDALYATNVHLHEEKHAEMVNQGRRIQEIIESAQSEKEALKYYDTAPNKYLKLLTGISLITKEYGDRKIRGASLFMNSMTYLSNEIRIEVEKRESLNLALKSLNAIVILPLFFMRPIKAWAVSNFFPLEKFYASQLGFIFEMALLAIIFLSYVALRKIQQVDEGAVNHQKKHWSNTLYTQVKGVIKPFVPKEGSKAHYAFMKLNRDTASYERIEHFYTRKIALGLLSMVLIAILIYAAQNLTIRNVYRAPTTDAGFMSGSLSPDERLLAEKTTAFDNRYLEKAKRSPMDTKALYAQLISEENYTEEAAQKAVDRIYGKYKLILHHRFMWYHLLVIIGSFYFGFWIPHMEAALKKQMIKIELEHEISQFQSIIALLMHVQHITVVDLLEWMERFSGIFREPIQRALLDYDSGAVETLEALKKATSYHEFQKLIEKMQSACDGLSIAQAFDDLDSEKLYYQERKKRMNQELVAKKVNLGQIIGFMPCYSFLVIYLMVPMLWSSMAEMQAYFKILEGF